MRKTLAERRVAIAKDALTQLKIGIYNTKIEGYIHLNPKLKRVFNTNPEKDAQECLLKNKKPCSVCAKGALALSAIRKENSIKMGDIYKSANVDDVYSEFGDGQGKGYLGKIFGKKNADLIEAVYEHWDTTDDQRTNAKINSFCHKYEDRTERLTAILKILIKNGGVFKFPKK